MLRTRGYPIRTDDARRHVPCSGRTILPCVTPIRTDDPPGDVRHRGQCTFLCISGTVLLCITPIRTDDPRRHAPCRGPTTRSCITPIRTDDPRRHVPSNRHSWIHRIPHSRQGGAPRSVDPRTASNTQKYASCVVLFLRPENGHESVRQSVKPNSRASHFDAQIGAHFLGTKS